MCPATFIGDHKKAWGMEKKIEMDSPKGRPNNLTEPHRRSKNTLEKKKNVGQGRMTNAAEIDVPETGVVMMKKEAGGAWGLNNAPKKKGKVEKNRRGTRKKNMPPK